jgi:hypothetical protein
MSIVFSQGEKQLEEEPYAPFDDESEEDNPENEP